MSFDPTSVANLFTWLNDGGFYTDTLGTLPVVNPGDPVRFWADASGQNHNAVGTSSIFPAYAPHTLGGHNAILSSVNHFLTLTTIAIFPVTIYVVFQFNNPPISSLELDFIGDNTKQIGINNFRFALSLTNQYEGADSNVHVLKAAFLGTNSHYSLDGAVDQTAITSTIPFSHINIGVYNDLGLNLNVYIAEVAIYNSTVLPADDANLKAYFINKYASFKPLQALNGLKSTLQSTSIFTPNNVALALHPEPYPLAGGPACYIYPGSHRVTTPFALGDGRYYYGMEGYIRARVVSESLRDVTYQDVSLLTDSVYGLLRTTHSVINATQIQFITDNIGQPIAYEPFIISSQTPVGRYRNAAEWAYVDLIYLVKYVDNLFNVLPDSTTQAPPLPSNLADILLSIQTYLISTNIFKPTQVIISLSVEPYPIMDTPFLFITPGTFNFNPPNVYGAGRDYATAIGSININVVMENEGDIVDRADQALGNLNPALGLLARVAAVVDRLQLYFPANLAGQLITEMPIYVTSIGEPQYYRSGNLSFIPITFFVRYQQALT